MPPKFKLPFLTDRNVADEVASLLAEYGNTFTPVLEPPIPVDEIVELYFELELELMDMKAEFKVDDVHGALWVNKRKVGIDQSLDPDENPRKLGRYRFTLAHEAGHWRLHRRLFQKRAANQLNLVAGNAERPEYICRSSDREPIEIQADMFAATLLMPEAMVRRVWHEQNGSSEPLSLDEIREKQDLMDICLVNSRSHFKEGDDSEVESIIEVAVLPMAAAFEVSPPAMKNRLKKLKLLVKKKEKTLFDKF